jgi:hypothetical protein
MRVTKGRALNGEISSQLTRGCPRTSPLRLFADLRVLDHIIIAGGDTMSFAERGLSNCGVPRLRRVGSEVPRYLAPHSYPVRNGGGPPLTGAPLVEKCPS